MRCIYLDKNGYCKAVPSDVVAEYKPSGEMLKSYCENTLDVEHCPRLRTYQKHLEALK